MSFLPSLPRQGQTNLVPHFLRLSLGSDLLCSPSRSTLPNGSWTEVPSKQLEALPVAGSRARRRGRRRSVRVGFGKGLRFIRPSRPGPDPPPNPWLASLPVAKALQEFDLALRGKKKRTKFVRDSQKKVQPTVSLEGEGGRLALGPLAASKAAVRASLSSAARGTFPV